MTYYLLSVPREMTPPLSEFVEILSWRSFFVMAVSKGHEVWLQLYPRPHLAGFTGLKMV